MEYLPVVVLVLLFVMCFLWLILKYLFSLSDRRYLEAANTSLENRVDELAKIIKAPVRVEMLEVAPVKQAKESTVQEQLAPLKTSVVQDSKAAGEDVINPGFELEKPPGEVHQLQMDLEVDLESTLFHSPPIIEVRATDTESEVQVTAFSGYSPPRISLLSDAELPDNEFLARIGATARPVSDASEHKTIHVTEEDRKFFDFDDGAASLPAETTEGAYGSEEIGAHEQIELDLPMERGKFCWRKGRQFLDFRVVEFFDSDLVLCELLGQDGETAVLQHPDLSDLSETDEFTAYIDVLDGLSKVVISIWRKQGSIEGNEVYEREAG